MAEAKLHLLLPCLFLALSLTPILLSPSATAYLTSHWPTSAFDMDSSESSVSSSSIYENLGFRSSLHGRSCDANNEDCYLDADALMDPHSHARMLYARYYISYGALVADRVPCPPMSGRSYYTRNCYTARGPVRPYNRGCSVITRCARDVS